MAKRHTHCPHCGECLTHWEIEEQHCYECERDLPPEEPEPKPEQAKLKPTEKPEELKVQPEETEDWEQYFEPPGCEY